MNQARILALLSLAVLAGCSSGQKEREEQRNRLSASSGLYCEFINGDEFQDIDVELNMSMARRCDSSKPFTLTQYKNSSDVNGLMYCCAIHRKDDRHEPSAQRSEAPAPRIEKKAPPAIAKPETTAPKAVAPVVPPVVETKPAPDAVEAGAAPVPMKPAAAPAAAAPTAAPAPAAAPAPKAATPSSAPTWKPAAKPAAPAQPVEDDGDIL